VINFGLISLVCYSWGRSKLFLSILPFIQRFVDSKTGLDFNHELTSFNPKMGYSMHVFIHAEGGEVALAGRRKRGLGEQ